MYALVDCNNFYASCERLFNPSLEGKPVVVLSNNDGCIIARSEEAKAIGLKMAEPYFHKIDLIKKHDVKCFSSNYTLYGDISQRVMDTLRIFVKDVEVYSIDEAFLVLNGVYDDLQSFIVNIRKKVIQYTGIPVSIGVAKTKSLAKIANKKAKKGDGVFIIDNYRQHDCILRNTPIGDIWGIGRQYLKLLESCNIKTAWDFTQINDTWIRKKLTVQGLRKKMELLGTPCIEFEEITPDKKAIATTRAFGKKTSELDIIKEAVSTYTTRCAEKLRKQKSVANIITVFIHTDPFNQNNKQYSASKTIILPVASNSTLELIKYALIGLKSIYKPDFIYKKAGVIVEGLNYDDKLQGNLFDQEDRGKLNSISKYTDIINKKYGKDTVKPAILGNGKEWNLKQEHLSKRYTTDWNEIITVKA